MMPAVRLTLVAAVLGLAPLWGQPARAETVIFLDNRPGVASRSTTYDPQTRTCGQGKHKVFTELDEAAQALAQADVLYIRAGTYGRASVGKYIQVHGNQVNYWTGSLAVNATGTPERRKRVSAYQDELVIIQAKPGVSHYNPDPADTSFKNSSHYYPHPAVSIGGSFMEVRGLKTYGQVVISGHDVVLEGCDLGGGGPHMNQGQVVALNGSGKPGGVYNVLIRNNRIHHSTWGEGAGNGSALMCYDASFIAENNEFFENYGPDLTIKDTGGQQGREIVIRYNFFGRSSINPHTNGGIFGHNQDRQADRVTIHNNVFLEKAVGVSFRMPARLGPMVAHCNTFVNCGYGRTDAGDVGDWINTQAEVSNNLYYHSRPGQKFYDLQTSPWDNLGSDHNLFFSTTGETAWKHLYQRRATTLAGWQHYSGRDGHSVWKDPQFVNPDGRRPEDFKRKGQAGGIQDVQGSRCGAVCGAYVTGDETIGLLAKRRKAD